MSYDSVRMDEQLRMLDHSIDDFISRYNSITTLSALQGVNPARQTLFLFPGGMASTLKRATKAWNAAGSRFPGLQLQDIVGQPGHAPRRGGTRSEDASNRGSLSRQGEPHHHCGRSRQSVRRHAVHGFTVWCSLKQIDWFVFPWDWRRSVDDVGTFFIDRFLPHFRERVQAECNDADPLADYSLIGHSAGGLVVNWILRKIAPLPATLAQSHHGRRAVLRLRRSAPSLVRGRATGQSIHRHTRP